MACPTPWPALASPCAQRALLGPPVAPRPRRLRILPSIPPVSGISSSVPPRPRPLTRHLPGEPGLGASPACSLGGRGQRCPGTELTLESRGRGAWICPAPARLLPAGRQPGCRYHWVTPRPKTPPGSTSSRSTEAKSAVGSGEAEAQLNYFQSGLRTLLLLSASVVASVKWR